MPDRCQLRSLRAEAANLSERMPRRSMSAGEVVRRTTGGSDATSSLRLAAMPLITFLSKTRGTGMSPPRTGTGPFHAKEGVP